ncbi:threonine-phosphate decarboxylase CobD [Marinobacter caseinilyticus]|uniref:threonine-phosphate decarboxylase CobD n=1 Tax=Marinobacter caseinilyticus TaxID=2692195 RepID=UPI00140DD1C0|nr:threonine-phosphate decarboxylase CobD [Marinobacter caseinilyticus]
MTRRPAHGGRLHAAARRWGIPYEEWLDLSTGINPHGWPVPGIPAALWQRLPEDDDGLTEVIRVWASPPTGAGVLAVAGSQAAIQGLPLQRAGARVAVPAPGYEEHRFGWLNAGHTVVALSPEQIDQQLDRLDVVVWIQPNNPTGVRLTSERLLGWHQRLAARGGWLVVDEAFLTAADTGSLVPFTDREGLIVLRSVGKFFGLAGIRAGAMFAIPALCQALNRSLGPWALSGPSRYVMAQALLDHDWQQGMTKTLRQDARRLRALLADVGLRPSGGTDLFQYVPHPQAGLLADRLARAGILVRRFDAPSALRFGLPGCEQDWQRLQAAMQSLVN